MFLHIFPQSSAETSPTLRKFVWEAGAGPQNWDSVTLLPGSRWSVLSKFGANRTPTSISFPLVARDGVLSRITVLKFFTVEHSQTSK